MGISSPPGRVAEEAKAGQSFLKEQSMKTMIRFKKSHEMRIDGQVRRFVAEQAIEVEQGEAIRLIRDGIALPGGFQCGAPVSNKKDR
jgi:chromosome condensin MukBEF MukE localization factor